MYSRKSQAETLTVYFDRSIINATPEENNLALLSQQSQKYVISKKEVYNSILEYLESSECNDDYFDDLIKIIDAQQLEKSQEEYEHFLNTISHISNNHHRDEIFIKKIFQIIQYYVQQIKQTLSNIQIFDIFRNNKKILLFLIENEIIELDKNIVQIIVNTFENNGNRYCDFFYPEIKKFLDQNQIKEIESNLLSKNDNIFDNFNENQHIGENDSYICTLIRKDSVKEFIQHVNQKNISLKSQIVPSIFETNPFLNDKNPTLIEYTAFFGSIQIFRYLMMNNVELTPSLWLYTIHSKNAELIHLLESNNVLPPQDQYILCLIESIKCHHNDISEYIKNNLIEFDKLNSKDYESVISSTLYYHNYFNFPTEFDKDDEFFYLCKYNYNELVETYLKKKEKFIIDLIKENRYSIKISKNTNDKIFIMYYSLLKQKRIDTNTFNNNNAIEKIAIPSVITSISDEFFSNCSSLKQISIPSSVTSIGNNAFNGCSSLAQITIPSSVTSIGNNAFNGCSSLAQITIPSSVTSIGNSAFRECSSLTQITIPSSVTSIGNGVFYGCSSLTQITIPPFVNSIGECALKNCLSLKQIAIPSSVTVIEEYAFSGCSSLTQIIIPSSVIFFGRNIFEGIISLDILGDIDHIPSVFFSKSSSLKQITIPSSVTKIEESAFKECSLLTQITIPSSVTSIGEGAFLGCSSLKQITIPSSVSEIGNCTFYGCSSLKQITIPSSVTSIGEYAFSRCSSLTQVTIPPSATSIGISTFSECSLLTQITIPPSVTSIGVCAFSGCSSLTQIIIPSSITSIGEYAFSRCSSLIQITIPSSVTSIGESAFSECSSLKQITIPSSINQNRLSIPSTANITTF